MWFVDLFNQKTDLFQKHLLYKLIVVFLMRIKNLQDEQKMYLSLMPARSLLCFSN
ncbi:hypothetical protein SEHO0A_pSEHO0A2p06290 (plasmid) [Salmonella enterica subsp. houtenae str. ATCC BAA-1581]|nr:hypothetical protein SEHO0A_pSEHO0A2p06290 [Salmonella enterica subsp. houtenae str. ATCC BAA-1581]